MKGTWKNPAIGSARADVVLIAPEAGVPLLFLEVDNCTEEAVLIAAKFDKYMRFFKRKEKNTDGIEKPMWRTRWSAPAWEEYARVHQPVLLVFHRVGKRSTKNQIQKVADPTRDHWQGRWHREEGFHSYDGCIPIMATTLELLREHGPAGPAFWRFGRDHREPLLDAIGTPAGTPFSPGAAKPIRNRNGGARNRKPRNGKPGAPTARTACRSSATTDGQRPTYGTGVQPSESHPYLCEDCQSRAVAAQRQADADERERQERERLRLEAEAEQAARKPGGWLGRWRT